MELKVLPQHLSEITLEQYVGWNETYGNALLQAANKLKTDDDKLLFQTEFYSKHYAWYYATSYEEVYAALNNGTDFYIEMLKVSAESLMSISRELTELQEVDVINALFGWQDIFWKIKPPVDITDETKVTLGQFDKVQDVALLLSDIQDGDTTALYELCELYLVPAEGQVKVPVDMHKLPLNIAKCVQKYLQDTVNLYKLLKHAANAQSASH